MGAWVAVVLGDRFHHTDSPCSPPTEPRAAGANQTGNVISGGSHDRAH
jgi:hypothetical protein